MNITNAKYHALEGDKTNPNASITCVVDDTNMSVPLDPANRHYAEILRQVEAGELTIEETDSCPISAKLLSQAASISLML